MESWQGEREMHRGLDGGLTGGEQVNITLLEPLRALRAVVWRAVKIWRPPKLLVIKEGSCLVFVVYVVARMTADIARLSVLRKGLNIRPLSFLE